MPFIDYSKPYLPSTVDIDIALITEGTEVAYVKQLDMYVFKCNEMYKKFGHAHLKCVQN